MDFLWLGVELKPKKEKTILVRPGDWFRWIGPPERVDYAGLTVYVTFEPSLVVEGAYKAIRFWGTGTQDTWDISGSLPAEYWKRLPKPA